MTSEISRVSIILAVSHQLIYHENIYFLIDLKRNLVYFNLVFPTVTERHMTKEKFGAISLELS